MQKNLLKSTLNQVSAFAPATSANLGVGFDILGLAIDNIGDKVTLTRRADNKIIIDKILGIANLPLDIQENTASFALQSMCEALKINCGFSLVIEKGIAIGSGMGGSAASAVAAVTALNGFLKKPLTKHELVQYALNGEALASGAKHADNVGPCIFGGLILIKQLEPFEIIQLPYPKLTCVLIHPHLEIKTQRARNILSPSISLKAHVAQSAHLAAAVAALHQKDLCLLQSALQDLIIEPQRAKLIPGFYAVKASALGVGAMSVTLSGSGPSLLAFCKNKSIADKVADAMLTTFGQYDTQADSYITPISAHGAYIL
jgi:homoserine kinase